MDSGSTGTYNCIECNLFPAIFQVHPSEVKLKLDSKCKQNKMIRRKLICDFCGKSEPGRGYLQRHIDNKHRKFHCSVCQRIYRKKLNLLDHLAGHFEVFICQYCGLEFSRFELFQRHVYQQHEPDNKKLILSIQAKESYECRFCIRIFPNAIRRNGHEMNVHKNRDEAAFKCMKCQTVFITKEELRSHSFEHYAGSLYFCAYPNCDRFFKTPKQLKSHNMIHEPARFQCDKCLQRFSQSSNFSRHKKRCKGKVTESPEVLTKEEVDRICTLAKQQFLELGGKLRNTNCQLIKKSQKVQALQVSDNKTLESQDKDESKILKTERSCEKSPRRSKIPKQADLTPLVKSSPEKSNENFICHVCAFPTTTQRQLRSHIDRKHRGVPSEKVPKPVILVTKMSSELICDICGVKKKKKFVLRKHMRCHLKTLDECEICHLKLRNVAKHRREVHTDDRSFICTVCKVGFKSSHNLKNHVKIHEEPSECPMCYKRLPNMHRHLQWHSRPTKVRHSCTECHKSCSTKQALQEHVLRIHEKVPLGKAYTCPDCDLTFIRNNDLRRHSYQHFTGKIFSCDFQDCNEMFKKAFKLQSHMMIHNPSNDLKFACELCDRRYLRKAALNKHRRQKHPS